MKIFLFFFCYKPLGYTDRVVSTIQMSRDKKINLTCAFFDESYFDIGTYHILSRTDVCSVQCVYYYMYILYIFKGHEKNMSVIETRLLHYNILYHIICKHIYIILYT